VQVRAQPLQGTRRCARCRARAAGTRLAQAHERDRVAGRAAGEHARALRRHILVLLRGPAEQRPAAAPRRRCAAAAFQVAARRAHRVRVKSSP